MKCPNCANKLLEEWSYYLNAARYRCNKCFQSFPLTHEATVHGYVMSAPRCLAVGRVEVDDRYDKIADQPSQFVAHQARAFATAVQTFQNTYGRLPDFDILNFRGMHTTTDIICEIWEEI